MAHCTFSAVPSSHLRILAALLREVTPHFFASHILPRAANTQHPTSTVIMSDDETAVLMAAAGAALAHLQVMRAAYSLLLDEDLDLDADPDAAATGRKRAGPLLSWEEELLLEGNDFEAEEGEDPRPAKHTRTSYPRPAYSASVWGVMLEGMRVLHAAGQLRPACTQAVEFRRRFRVPYEFFLWLVETVKPWFANVTQDVARRECVPVTLKVRNLPYIGIRRIALAGSDVQVA